MMSSESWRHTPPHAGDAGGAMPDWRRGRGVAAASPERAWRWKVGLGWGSFLALCAGFLWISTWIRPPKPGRLILLGAGYQTNLLLPENVAGVNSLKRLAAWAEEPRSLLRTGGQGLLELRTDQAWESALDRIEESTVMVVVSAHGGRDAKGPYLLAHDTDLRDHPRHRLRVDLLLDRLADLPRHVRKLLVLDATALTSQPALGMLHNDFARALLDLETRIASIPNLVVLCASSPDQRAWSSHDWQESAFGHFLREGLRGLADRDHDQRVNAWELGEYLRENVDRWARINRLAEQVPMLLPRGTEGEQRARAMLVSLAERHYRPAPLEEVSEWSPPARLKEVWTKWRALSGTNPNVYSPQFWQKYQAGTFRLERLLRWGDEAGAKEMEFQLERWERGFEEARRVQTHALDAYWSLAQTGRDAPVKDERLEKTFDELWQAPTAEEAKKKWEGWLGGDPKALPSRVGLTQMMAQRVVQEPTKLANAVDRLRLLREGTSPLPPHIHYLMMLRRDLPPNPPQAELAETLPLAVRVRIQAEQLALATSDEGYSYREHVYPWLAPRWAQADLDRQLGQDLLFSGSAADWQRAREMLTRSGEKYTQLQADAAQLRRGFRARERAHAILPWYGEWLVERPTVGADVEAEVLRAWQTCHALDALLNQPESATSQAIADQASHLEKGLAALDAQLAKHLQKLRTSRTIDVADARQVWHETEAALLVPPQDLDLRHDLVVRQHRLSRLVLVAGNDQPAPDVPVGASQNAQAGVLRQGLLTLNRLGSTWISRLTPAGGEDFDQLQHRLRIFAVEEKWWESAAAAGAQIGDRLRRQGEELRRLCSIDPKADWPAIRSSLRQADRLVRLLDAKTPFVPPPTGPARSFRRCLVGDLLLGQTERVWRDHWYDENPAAEPYYRTVCRGLLLDARSAGTGLGDAAGTPGGWRRVLEPWDAKLQLPGELVLVDTTDRIRSDKGQLLPNPDRFAVLTSETAQRREYRLQPSRPDDVFPEGLPVVWVEAFQGLVPVDPAERERRIMPLTPERQRLEDAAALECHFTSPLVAEAEEKQAALPRQQTRLNLKGVFRGQPIALETRVEVHPVPETIVRQFPLPAKATVAVRTQRETHTRIASAQGAVAFILDCSGSMRFAAPSNPEVTRFSQAADILRRIVERLPKDTQVSLWTFGQAMGSEKTVDVPEKTILPVVPPTLWNPLDPSHAGKLTSLSQLATLEPWNESPLARTLLMAREDLRKTKGYKAIVAITDGGDNRFEKDKELKARYVTLPDLLKTEFGKSDIALHVVTFPAADLDEKKAQEELKVIESFAPAGRLYKLEETPKLMESLESLLRQRLNYTIDYRGRNVPVDAVPVKGQDISPAGTNYRWIGQGLPPGGHKVRVDVGPRLEKDVLLNAGDLLMVDLVSTPKGLEFERFLFSSDFPWKRSLENARKDWKLTVLQNQLLPTQDLEMLLTLEKTVDRRESVLEQIKPREVWVEVDAGSEDASSRNVRWHYFSGFPAPAWTVKAPKWGAIRPRVQVWWSPDEEGRAAADLELGPLLQERQRQVFLPNEAPATIESLGVERHVVEVAPGKYAPRQCLVVRVRHTPGRPILTRLHGVAPTGAEHRFYTQANKAAGLFWFDPDLDPMTRPGQLDRARLRLISIEAFKDEARRRDYWLEIRDLETPDPADERPRPPVELR